MFLCRFFCLFFFSGAANRFQDNGFAVRELAFDKALGGFTLWSIEFGAVDPSQADGFMFLVVKTGVDLEL